MRLRVILSCTMSTALAMVPKTLGGWCAGDSFSPNSVVPYCLMVMAIRSTKSPSPSLFSFGFFLAECRPMSSPFRLTARTMSAPSARQTEIGTGLTSPPSNSQRS